MLLNLIEQGLVTDIEARGRQLPVPIATLSSPRACTKWKAGQDLPQKNKRPGMKNQRELRERSQEHFIMLQAFTNRGYGG